MLNHVHSGLMRHIRPPLAARFSKAWLLLSVAGLAVAVSSAWAQQTPAPKAAQTSEAGRIEGLRSGRGIDGLRGALGQPTPSSRKTPLAKPVTLRPSEATSLPRGAKAAKPLKIADVKPTTPKAGEAESLADAIASALASNIEILIAEAQRDEALFGRSEARAALLPNVELNASRGRELTKPQGTIEPDTHTRSELAVALRQNVWDFGAATSTARSADFTAESADWAYRAQVDTVALQIASVFHDLLERQAIVTLAEGNVAAHETILKTVQSQREFGMVTGADVSRVEGRLNAARSELLDRRSAFEQARENYRRLLNRAPGRLVEPVNLDAALPKDIEEAVLELERRNPNVMRAKMLMRSLQRQRAAQRAGMLPKFDLEVQGAIRTNAGSDNGRNDEARAVIGMKVPLFDGGAKQAAVNRTSSRLRQAELQILRALRDAEQAIRNDYTALVAANDKVTTIEAEVAAAQNQATLYAEQFRSGNRSVFDLLDGQQSLFQAQVKRESNRKEKRLSGYRVLGTLGSLTSTLDIDRFGAPPMIGEDPQPDLAPLPSRHPAAALAPAPSRDKPQPQAAPTPTEHAKAPQRPKPAPARAAAAAKKEKKNTAAAKPPTSNPPKPAAPVTPLPAVVAQTKPAVTKPMPAKAPDNDLPIATAPRRSAGQIDGSR
jgi:outer membrane protein, adhesin transport system